MEHVTLVRHNSYIFKGTVAENLRMAKPEATEEEMKGVLSRVNLLGFLETWEGLETKLLEQGLICPEDSGRGWPLQEHFSTILLYISLTRPRLISMQRAKT